MLFLFGEASFSLPPPEPLSSFRCSGGIASVGDTEHDVRAKCGEPYRVRQIRGEITEQWIYKFSETGSFYYLQFQRGRLERIESNVESDE